MLKPCRMFLPIILLSACGTVRSFSANTGDTCAGATVRGARESFTLEQITPCLNSIEKVSEFMKNNVERDDGWDGRECGEICYSPAWLVYQNGADSLHGTVTLECYFLEKNGFDAYHIGLAIELPTGTNLCGVNLNGSVLVLDYDGKTAGTYDTLAEVARYYINNFGVEPGGKLRTIKASQIIQLSTNHTTPTILGLPWEIHPY